MNTIQSFNLALKIYFGLDNRQTKEYYLIGRYYDKVSQRLKDRKLELERIAESGQNSILREQLYKENYLLNMISKDKYEGSLYCHPINFGKIKE